MLLFLNSDQLKMPEILTVHNLTKTFGNLTAVDSLSFNVKEGEILGMMGPNGAGKTTVFNLITGVYKPSRGQVIYKNTEVTHFSASHRCRLGIGRTYQIPRPFENMTVFENLLVGAEYGANLKGKASPVSKPRKFSTSRGSCPKRIFSRGSFPPSSTERDLNWPGP